MTPAIDAVVLAAGTSSRMAPGHKLLMQGADGRPMIRRTLDQLRGSRLRDIHVVLGHAAAAVRAAIGDAAVRCVVCPDYALGLAHSLGAGLGVLRADSQAVLVALADMPLVGAGLVDLMIASWRPGCVVVPVHDGRRGNPILWDGGCVPAMRHLHGDRGARKLLDGCAVIEVAAADDAIFRDADTQAALLALPGGPWRMPPGTAGRTRPSAPG